MKEKNIFNILVKKIGKVFNQQNPTYLSTLVIVIICFIMIIIGLGMLMSLFI